MTMMIPATTICAGGTPHTAILPDRLAPGLGLHARCLVQDCRAASPIDPGYWLDQGLSGARLDRLETRLRCVCGARRARLEIAPLDASARAGRGTIYVFC